VSFAHGSNDGQKGMGLIMLILIGILPGAFALNLDTTQKQIKSTVADSQVVSAQMLAHSHGVVLTVARSNQELSAFMKPGGSAGDNTFAAVSAACVDLSNRLRGKQSISQLTNIQRSQLRTDAYLVSESIAKLDKKKLLSKAEDKIATNYEKNDLDTITKFIPPWVKVAVAIALGLGTTIGWKRIVVTVGEKIGKEHLTYAQGASAELVAMGTIMAASAYGLPVSTTHVLSSGIAGTMAANGSGLQPNTVRNIILAWVLTLPVCILLGATVFSASIYCLIHIFHGH
jgi:PiT family inorganic phosphate transporter